MQKLDDHFMEPAVWTATADAFIRCDERIRNAHAAAEKANALLAEAEKTKEAHAEKLRDTVGVNVRVRAFRTSAGTVVVFFNEGAANGLYVVPLE